LGCDMFRALDVWWRMRTFEKESELLICCLALLVRYYTPQRHSERDEMLHR
jgi:hypothetical protein